MVTAPTVLSPLNLRLCPRSVYRSPSTPPIFHARRAADIQPACPDEALTVDCGRRATWEKSWHLLWTHMPVPQEQGTKMCVMQQANGRSGMLFYSTALGTTHTYRPWVFTSTYITFLYKAPLSR